MESAKKGYFRLNKDLKLTLVEDKSDQNTLVFHTSKLPDHSGRVIDCDLTIIFDVREMRAKLLEKAKESAERKHKADTAAAKEVIEGSAKKIVSEADRKTAELQSAIEKVRKEHDEKYAQVSKRANGIDEKQLMLADESRRIALQLAEQQRIGRETKEKAEAAYSLGIDARRRTDALDVKVKEFELRFNSIYTSLMDLRGGQEAIAKRLSAVGARCEQLHGMTAVLWDEHNNNPNLRARVEAIKTKNIYLHWYQRRLSNLLMSAITRMRCRQDAIDKFKPEDFISSIIKLSADHVTCIPLLSGLLKTAAAGIDCYSARKRRKKFDAQESTNPQFQHELCIGLSVAVANALGLSFTGKDPKGAAESLGDQTLVLVFAAIAKLEPRLNPESPHYLDMDSSEFITAILEQIQTSPDPAFKQFREITKLGSPGVHTYKQSTLTAFEARAKDASDTVSDFYAALPPDLVSGAQSSVQAFAKAFV